PWMLSLLLGAPSGALAVQTVTNLNDSGAGSLRAAIAEAAATDQIVFAPGLKGVIPLTTGELVISKNLTITFAGQPPDSLAVSGEFRSRVLSVSSGVTVRITGLVFFHGALRNQNGTGVLNSGTLTLTSCAVRNNSSGVDGGGGILNQSLATLTI